MYGYYDYIYGYDFSYILLVIGFIIVLFAQIKINSAYNKYKKVKCKSEITGAEAARLILKKHGLDLYVVETNGNLTDHYDPSRKVIKLSRDIYNKATLASVAVAAHECGHAIQDQEGYKYMRIRSSLVPIVNFINYMGYIAMIVSLLAGAMSYFMVGILIVLATLLFQLVTLPVEFDASKRALVELQELNIVTEEEQNGSKKVLSAAAFTYVAGLLSTLLQLLRLVLLLTRNRRD